MNPIAHVLCPVDFSDGSRRALAQAAAVARPGARLTALHVIVNRATMDVPPLALEAGDRERLADKMRTLVAAVAPGIHADIHMREAEFVDLAIVDAVAEFDPDLLVLGTHGRSGFRRLVLGSVTEKVIRRAACPTLVVPPGLREVATGAPAIRQIICPVDFSASSLAAMTHALRMAQEAGARLLVLHVVELPPVLPDLPPAPETGVVAARTADEARRRLEARISPAARALCSIESVVVGGRAYREIIRAAAERQADLIVIGVRGRGAVDLLLFGSTTHHVLRAATCPVLIVHSEDGVAAWRQHRDPHAPVQSVPVQERPGTMFEARS